MAKLRHEINLLNGTLVGAVAANERVMFDPRPFSGTITVYLEAFASVSSGSVNLTLTDGTNSWTLAFSSPTYTISRVSISISLATYTFNLWLSGAANLTVKAARLIIVQNTGGDKLRGCETQIEIGSRSVTTATAWPPATGASASNQQNPKYWYYDASKWDNITAIFVEYCWNTASSKSVSSMALQMADGTGDGFTGWTNLSGSLQGASLVTPPVRGRSSNILPEMTANRWYRIMGGSGQSKTGMNIYSAKIIIQQASAAAATLLAQTTVGTNRVISGMGGEGILAQNFTNGASSVLVTTINIAQVNAINATDNLYVEIATSRGGTVIATSNLFSAGVNQDISFSSPPTLAASTEYWIHVKRTGPYDGSATYWIIYASNVDAYAGGQIYMYSSSTWLSYANQDLAFSLIGYQASDLGITKLQPQYLIANTLLAAGTALQTQLMNWDTNDWSGVANAYKLQACAANGSTSDVQLRTADDATLVATVTDPDNAGSGTATMP